MKTAMFSPLHSVVALVTAMILSASPAFAQQPAVPPDHDSDVEKLELPAPLPLLSESQDLQAPSGPERLPLSMTANVSRFTGTAIIELTLPYNGSVTLTIADMYGKVTATLLETWLDAGRHVVTWIPKDVHPGIYFVTARMGDQVQSTRVEIFK